MAVALAPAERRDYMWINPLGSAHPEGSRPMPTTDWSSTDEPLATITTQRTDRGTRASVSGEIDMSNAQDVMNSLLAAADGALGLVVDVTAVAFMDSHAVAGLHRLTRDLQATGRPLVIVTGQNTPAQRVLAMSGMEQVLALQLEDPEPRSIES